ncbi:unnamed protein product, partial [Prorocentrum cordatum]
RRRARLVGRARGRATRPRKGGARGQRVALEAQSSLRRIKSCFLDLVAELPGPWSEWRMRRRQDLERKWQQEMSEEAFKFAPLQTIEEERRQAKEGIFTPQESRYAPSKNSRIKPAEPLGKLPVDERRRMVVVGSGPAGYTAALYSGRALLRPLMFAGDLPGGQLMLTSDVENFPGYTEAVGGPTLMEDLRKQAEKFGAEVREQTVTAVDLSVRPFRVRVPSKEKEHGHIIETDALVISTGASAKWLGVEGEEQVKGRGVSTCATCDAALCFDEDVLVVGGGDVAFEDALFLARFAKSITLIHRSDVFKAQAIMQKRAQREPKVKIVTFCQAPRQRRQGTDGRRSTQLEDRRDADHALRGGIRGHRPRIAVAPLQGAADAGRGRVHCPRAARVQHPVQRPRRLRVRRRRGPQVPPGHHRGGLRVCRRARRRALAGPHPRVMAWLGGVRTRAGCRSRCASGSSKWQT